MLAMATRTNAELLAMLRRPESWSDLDEGLTAVQEILRRVDMTEDEADQLLDALDELQLALRALIPGVPRPLKEATMDTSEQRDIFSIGEDLQQTALKINSLCELFRDGTAAAIIKENLPPQLAEEAFRLQRLAHELDEL